MPSPMRRVLVAVALVAAAVAAARLTRRRPAPACGAWQPLEG